MPVLLNKQRATMEEGSTNRGAKEAEIFLGKGKQPDLVELVSKDQNRQANKGTISLKGVSTESKVQPGKAKQTHVSSENVSKKQMKKKTQENTSLSGSSEESVTGPVQANRNEEINNQPPEIDLLTTIQETQVQNDCYKQYLKEVPQQWEPLNNLKMYKEYVDLYEKRYNCYISIRKALEKTIEEFKEMKQNMDKAKHEKNRDLFYQLIQSTRKKHAEVENIYCSRRKAYMILHKELGNLKGQILRFYEANSIIMDSSVTSLTQH